MTDVCRFRKGLFEGKYTFKSDVSASGRKSRLCTGFTPLHAKWHIRPDKTAPQVLQAPAVWKPDNFIYCISHDRAHPTYSVWWFWRDFHPFNNWDQLQVGGFSIGLTSRTCKHVTEVACINLCYCVQRSKRLTLEVAVIIMERFCLRCVQTPE